MGLGHCALKKFLRGSKGVCLKSGRAQQPSQGASEALVVLNNTDDAFACRRVWVVHCPVLSQTSGHSPLYLWAIRGPGKQSAYTF